MQLGKGAQRRVQMLVEVERRKSASIQRMFLSGHVSSYRLDTSSLISLSIVSALTASLLTGINPYFLSSLDSILRLSSLNCHSMVMLLMVCHPLNFVSLLLLSGSLLSGHSIAQFDFTNRNCGSHVLTSYWSILLKELMVTRYNRIGLY